MTDDIPGGDADKPKLTLGSGAEKRQAAQLAAWVEGVGITVIRIPLDELRAKAAQHIREKDPQFDEGHTEQAKDAFVKRYMLHYARHTLTQYNHLLPKIVGQVGQAQAYILLKGRINNAIRQAYPELTGELTRETKFTLTVAEPEPSLEPQRRRRRRNRNKDARAILLPAEATKGVLSAAVIIGHQDEGVLDMSRELCDAIYDDPCNSDGVR
jgi:hypothetical protein